MSIVDRTRRIAGSRAARYTVFVVVAVCAVYFYRLDPWHLTTFVLTGSAMGAFTTLVLWPDFERARPAVIGALVGGLLVSVAGEIATAIWDFWSLRMLAEWPGACLGAAMGTAIGDRGRIDLGASLVLGACCSGLLATFYPWSLYLLSASGALSASLTMWRSPIESFLVGVCLTTVVGGGTAVVLDLLLDVGGRLIERIARPASTPPDAAIAKNPRQGINTDPGTRLGEAILICVIGGLCGFAAVLVAVIITFLAGLGTAIVTQGSGFYMQAPFIFGQATGAGLGLGLVFGILLMLRPHNPRRFEALAVTIAGGSGAWTIYGSVGSMVVYAVVYYGGGMDKEWSNQIFGASFTYLGLFNAGLILLAGCRALLCAQADADLKASGETDRQTRRHSLAFAIQRFYQQTWRSLARLDD